MSFTDINDPAGVKALLDQLRSSQAWQEAVTCTANPSHSEPATSRNGEQATTVASLLSQLHSHPTHTPRNATISSTVDTVGPDLRAMTFQRALPRLADLSGKPEFLDTIREMKSQQDNLERELWQERRGIQRRHEGKVNVRRMEADRLGDVLKEEADTMTLSFQQELHKFDMERVLPAWDALIENQQERLQKLGVPTMFSTRSIADREKQRRVVQVLEGAC